MSKNVQPGNLKNLTAYWLEHDGWLEMYENTIRILCAAAVACARTKNVSTAWLERK